MGQIRLFVAVEIPAEVRGRLAEIERQLMDSDADVKWVPEQNFHMTLKFLGNTDEGRLGTIKSALECAVQGIAPFEVGLAGVGAFPNPKRPSVVWVGVKSGVGPLRALAEKIELAMESIGFDRKDRPFKAHMTLGRTRSPRNSERLRELIEQLQDAEAGNFRVEGVALMKSELRPSGPVYTRIADVRFQIAD